MCVVSMVMDHYWDKWRENPGSITVTPQIVYPPTQEEVDEFRALLKRAREYDKKHNQPDCELEEKKQKLMKLADELGIKIDFI